MNDGILPVKYVLYSHYGTSEAADEAAYRRSGGDAELKEPGFLASYLSGLKELLETPGHEGMLVLFYSPGFAEFLTELGRTEKRGTPEELRFADEVGRRIRRKLAEAGLDDRVRFITSVDLKELLGSVHPHFGESFREFITGSAPRLRYDAPKIVEAIIRLRLLGTGVPVFRIDQDVIFAVENRDRPDLGLFKAIACSVRAYEMRQSHPNVSTFLFSASYDQRAVTSRLPRAHRLAPWSRAFATRVYPAVIADRVEISDICHLPPDEQEAAWQDYLERHLDLRLVRRFYGLKSRLEQLACHRQEGLPAIGAHPLFAVISGALLCLSEGAILDLPPFSNFRNNVMWIDDHLKYSLHRAMNHFTYRERLQGEPELSFARLQGVTVVKSRPRVSNLPVYVFGNYLPTLLWGTVMDAWITDDPLAKCRRAELRISEWKRREAARQAPPTALLPRTLYSALQVGRFSGSSPELRREFESVALRRIEEVRRLWGALSIGGRQTFASYWARGEVRSAFGSEMFADEPELTWQGIAPGKDHDKPLSRLTQIPELRPPLSDLIDDVFGYIRWTLAWPRFVQIVRSMRQGDFAADVSWRPR
jgi:hypothetical protein